MAKWETTSGNRRFVIVEDHPDGFYLYVFKGNENTHDHHQDTFEHAVEQAHEEFGVNPTSWAPIED